MTDPDESFDKGETQFLPEETVSPVPEGQQPLQSIGPYRLLRMIGEGGMGTVYLAEQQAPVRRQVAIKIVKLGMDTKEVIARFESERQALALMSHPNIARVFDAGSSERGRPYFVMEYVPGPPLTRYCDEHRIGTVERLQLFADTCDAVQHAHQKGILHRDLKPSNILVTEIEGEPTVKIIDFGLAKAMGQQLTEKTLFTQHGMLIGTPAYMSPEQAEPSGGDIDTRTDIYALGVVLYELLVGELPFDFSDAVKKAAFGEIRRRLVEEDPPKPSTRFTMFEMRDQSDHAQRRRIEPSTLARRLRGELDWITMKALEKDRALRYATAADFAADVRRFLDGEPVLAGPPSTTYRVKKIVRKHAGFFAIAAALLGMLVVGTVVSTVLYLRAEAARELAIQRETEARSATLLADEARRDAESQAAEILRLSDLHRLAEVRALAEELWPPTPELVPRMTAWLERSRALLENLPVHRASLEALREEAGPSHRFADAESQWRHDTLAELVNELEAFGGSGEGLVASVERRHALARELSGKTLEDGRDLWDDAIRSIADPAESPAYAGLRLTPQLGLIPLGPDPDSRLHEFLHLATHEGPIPERDADGRLPIDEDTGVVLVLLPGGQFIMGAQPPGRRKKEGEPNCDPHAVSFEAPIHEVTISPFFLAKFELTQAQWTRMTGSNPSVFPPSENEQVQHVVTGLHPVENVDWAACDLWVSRWGLTLPTEAQWEFATRAGTSSVWWTGNDKTTLEGTLNLADLRCQKSYGLPTWDYDEWLDDGHAIHAPVGSYRPNAFGLHDTLGNVWEWCRDLHATYGRRATNGDEPRARPSSTMRINRGGSFSRSARNVRCARRRFNEPDYRFEDLGVRVSRAID